MISYSFSRVVAGCLVAACAGFLATPASAGPRYHVTDLGAAVSPYASAVAALNRAGVAVGSELVDGTLSCVSFDHGAVADLGTMGGSTCEALGINDSGVVVGALALPDGSGNMHAFLYRDGVAQDLGALPGYPNSEAVAVNKHGYVAGNSSSPIYSQALIWHNGKVHRIPVPADGVDNLAAAINVHNDVTGTVRMTNDHQHAFVWRDGRSVDLGTIDNLSNGESAGNAINDQGQVAGFSSSAAFRSHAVVFTGGTIVDLGTIPANDAFATSVATSIDNRGWVVGTSDDGGGTTYGFLWDGKKTRDLGELLDAESTAAWQIVSAQAINKLGQITGMAISRADGLMHAYLAAQIQ